MPDPDSSDDTAVPPDPFEAELVAYLDGELDGDDARRVEERLAADPAARARAAALKGTFDLLDYLPQAEPSPTFASRTLDRLPTSAPSGAATRPSGSAALPLGSAAVPAAAAPARWGRFAAAALVAATCAAVAGYFATSAARPYLFPAPPPAELSISDHRVVGLLPLYAAADDLDYARELAKPEFFGDDPAVAFDPPGKAPALEPDAPTGPAFDALAAAFQALPPARRDAVRDLDRQLHAVEPAAARDHLLRVLEVYALWLDRLSDAERRAVLSATTPRGRLDEVRKLRGQQWFDALPEAQRKRLNDLPPERRDQLLLRLREDEGRWREEWAELRRHAPDIVADRAPWPFDDDRLRREVVEFGRVALRPDDEKRPRLTAAEAEAYRSALAAAEKGGGWAWYRYGKTVHELRRKYEPYLLPEPATGEPVTTYAQLGPARAFFEREKSAAHKVTSALVGRWPDFALAVSGYAATAPKGDKLPPLGPSRPGEFKEPLRTFVLKELVPGLPAADAKALAAAEGRWPEYPREVVRLSRQQDVSAPGLMLPGSPKRWEVLYGRPPRPQP